MLSKIRLYIPLFLSLLRIFLTPVFIVLFIQGGIYSYVAVVVFTCAALTDYFDGYFARKYNVTTSYGMFLDPLADKVFVLSSFALFWNYDFIATWMMVVILVREILITALRIVAEYSGKHVTTLWHGKYKTTFQMILLYCMQVYVLMSPTQPFLGEVLRVFTLCVVGFTIFSGMLYIKENSKLFWRR